VRFFHLANTLISFHVFCHTFWQFMVWGACHLSPLNLHKMIGCFFSIQPTKNNNHVHLNHFKEWTYRECNFCQYWASWSCIHQSTTLVLEAPWIVYFSSSQKNHYNYIQDSCFLGQMARQKVFMFKMLFYGPISGIHLVRHMQP
jgi:hypothetical protein